uniref:Glycosyltransferase n=1 Tax=candidate division WOR-3 bacterium TaxID=2052148 RepID=A0A7C2PLT9_UNCW3
MNTIRSKKGNVNSIYKVCAVVLTYNRKTILLECLEALRKQTRPLQGIYIIDNASNDGTPEILKEKGYIVELPPENIKDPWEQESIISNLINGNAIKIYYVRMHKNTGSAGGFYEGIKRAFEKGYDWLWIMDDDVEPYYDCLEKLSRHFDKRALMPLIIFDTNDYPCVCGFKLKSRTLLIFTPLKQKEFQMRNVVEIDVASTFAGFIVNREVISKVGYPEPRLFIHYDDTDFSLRIRKITQIFLIKDAKVLHKWQKPDRSIKPFGNINLWREYYLERNRIILRKWHIKSKFALLVYLAFDFILLNKRAINYLIKGVPWKEVKLLYYAFLDALTENLERDLNTVT